MKKPIKLKEGKWKGQWIVYLEDYEWQCLFPTSKMAFDFYNRWQASGLNDKEFFELARVTQQ